MARERTHWVQVVWMEGISSRDKGSISGTPHRGESNRHRADIITFVALIFQPDGMKSEEILVLHVQEHRDA